MTKLIPSTLIEDSTGRLQLNYNTQSSLNLGTREKQWNIAISEADKHLLESISSGKIQEILEKIKQKYLQVFIISGPSGAGKGTIVGGIQNFLPQTKVSISTTTRGIREGEVNGKDYNFVDGATFEDIKSKGQFLESAEYAGNQYGTPISAIDEITKNGQLPLLEIDLNGARQAGEKLQKAGYSVKVIFVMQSTLALTQERLNGRGNMTESSVSKRMQRAHEELSEAGGIVDVFLLNDVSDKGGSAIESLVKVITAKESLLHSESSV